jgi:hypothetical protein
VPVVRIGTLDDPDLCPPDIQIYTPSKQPRLDLPAETPSIPEGYDCEHY